MCPRCGKIGFYKPEKDRHGIESMHCSYCGYQDFIGFPTRSGKTRSEHERNLLEKSRADILKDGLGLKRTMRIQAKREWKELGGIIRAGMKRKGVSAQKLANEIGMSKKAIENYVSGRFRPKRCVAEILERSLRISIMQFYPQDQKEVAA